MWTLRSALERRKGLLVASVDKKAYIVAAKMTGDSVEMDVAAEAVRAKAANYASAHTSNDNRGDTYAESFKVDNVPATGVGYVRDRFVYSDDRNALSKEFGHMTKGKNPKWVPGQFSLIRAANG